MISDAIDRFEKQNTFKITPFIQSKTGFDLIKGLALAFDSYKIEIASVQTAYTDFFNGKRYDKIEPEYNLVLFNVSWFMGIFGEAKKDLYSTLSDEQIKEANEMFVDIAEEFNSCSQYNISNMNNFNLYNHYFIKLKEHGFNMSDDDENESYITFPEYVRNSPIIEQRDYEQFKAQIRADRISGKY
jgi:hypothetical protein